MGMMPYHGAAHLPDNEQEWLIEPTGLLGFEQVQQELLHNQDGFVAQLYQRYEWLRAFGVENHAYFNPLYR